MHINACIQILTYERNLKIIIVSLMNKIDLFSPNWFMTLLLELLLDKRIMR